MIKVFCFLSLFSFLIGPQLFAKDVAGYVEFISLMRNNMRFRVKLDTGAKTSSLGVHEMKFYDDEVTGEKRVAFKVRHPKRQTLVDFDLPVVRSTKIKKRSSEVKNLENGSVVYDIRPVVNLHVCIGDKVRYIEVNLTRRDHFNYQMIVGREGLKEFDFMIDPGSSFVKKLNCKNHLLNTP